MCATESPQQLVHLTEATGFSWEKEKHSRGSARLLFSQMWSQCLTRTPYQLFLPGISFFSKQFSNVSILKKPQTNPKTQIPTFLKMFAKFTKEGRWFQPGVPLFVVKKSGVGYMNIFSPFSCSQPTLTVNLLKTFK